jgi:uncharacterized peroxidase-related enzyme
MLDFAVKVTLHSAEINDTDFERMRKHGFTDDEIWDTGTISAFFELSNHIANFKTMRPNDEF